jgi:pimeloyl-ACP methyl ester carboxylesterase
MVTDAYALINGLRIHFRDWRGPAPDAPVLLLLHGFASHARTWDVFAPAFATRFRVVAADARGHGESQWSPASDYAADAQVSDVIGLVGALGYDRIALIGISMGGRTAYTLAARYPDLVERLVVVDISPSIMATGSDRIRRNVEASNRFASIDEAVQAQLAQWPTAPAELVRRRVTHNLLLTDDGQFTWRYDAALRRPGGLARPAPEDGWPSLAQIMAPTLLLRGANSDILSAEDAARFVKTVPDAELAEIADAGHSIALEQPARFLAAVAPFLLA